MKGRGGPTVNTPLTVDLQAASRVSAFAVYQHTYPIVFVLTHTTKDTSTDLLTYLSAVRRQTHPPIRRPTHPPNTASTEYPHNYQHTHQF